MREFNIKINQDVLKSTPKNPMLEDEKLNEVFSVADEIIEVFRKRKTTMEDAFFILSSLADSIYMYSTFEDQMLK